MHYEIITATQQKKNEKIINAFNSISFKKLELIDIKPFSIR